MCTVIILRTNDVANRKIDTYFGGQQVSRNYRIKNFSKPRAYRTMQESRVPRENAVNGKKLQDLTSNLLPRRAV